MGRGFDIGLFSYCALKYAQKIEMSSERSLTYSGRSLPVSKLSDREEKVTGFVVALWNVKCVKFGRGSAWM